MVSKRYKKYPNLLASMIDRHNNYNSAIEKIIELEKQNKIFVVRPSEKIDIKLIERNKEKLQQVYELGQKDARNKVKSLKKYLERN